MLYALQFYLLHHHPYQKILNEAVDELKENEFNDLYKTHERKKHEIIFETDLEVYFPSSYINNISETKSNENNTLYDKNDIIVLYEYNPVF